MQSDPRPTQGVARVRDEARRGRDRGAVAGCPGRGDDAFVEGAGGIGEGAAGAVPAFAQRVAGALELRAQGIVGEAGQNRVGRAVGFDLDARAGDPVDSRKANEERCAVPPLVITSTSVFGASPISAVSGDR